MTGDPRGPAAPDDDRDDAPDVLRLDDALKLAGVVATGGQAKQLIQSGSVRVNGSVETRRKRKLVEGDVVEVGDERFEIALAEEDDGTDDVDELAPDEGGREDDAVAALAPDGGQVGDDRGGDEDDEDDDAGGDALTEPELERWSAWVVDRIADDDAEAVILRLGSLHPDALEALFARLPSDVEEAVLDALDAVLEDEARDDRELFGQGDGPLQA